MSFTVGAAHVHVRRHLYRSNAGSDVTSDTITAFRQHLKQNPPKPATSTPARPLHKTSAYVSPPSTGPR